MKHSRITAAGAAVCVLLAGMTALPADAAEDVAAQVSAASTEYSVLTKKLGYTALNTDVPELPPWYVGNEKERQEQAAQYGSPYTSWEENWKQYTDSASSPEGFGGYGPPTYGAASIGNHCVMIRDFDTGGYGGIVKFLLVDKNGKVKFNTALLGVDYTRHNWDINTHTLSIADGCYIYTAYDRNYYYDLNTNDTFDYFSGDRFFNGYASVLEADEGMMIRDVPQFYYDDIQTGHRILGDSVKCRFSIINEKNEKIFTASEPIELINTYNGGAASDFIGANYTLQVGGYNDGLFWFWCDRQLGDTLNDLIPNTEQIDKTTLYYPYDMLNNQYALAEHQCGYADLNGNIVIPQKFDTVYPFSEGLALVITESKTDGSTTPVKKAGFIDKTGNYVIEPKFDYQILFDHSTYQNFNSINSFSDGVAMIGIRDENGNAKCGYIDKTGEYIIEPQFEAANDFKNGIASVKKDGKWGYINKQGEAILPIEYEAAYGTDGTYFTVGKTVGETVKYGVVDADGTTVLPFIFEDLSTPDNGLVFGFCDRELYSFAMSRADLVTGDPDGRDGITISDAQIVLEEFTAVMSGDPVSLTDAQIKAADIDGDGKITVADAQYILLYYTANTVAHKPTTWEELLAEASGES